MSKIDQSQSDGMNNSEKLSRKRQVYRISYPGDGPQRAQVPAQGCAFLDALISPHCSEKSLLSASGVCTIGMN